MWSISKPVSKNFENALHLFGFPDPLLNTPVKIFPFTEIALFEFEGVKDISSILLSPNIFSAHLVQEISELLDIFHLPQFY